METSTKQLRLELQCCMSKVKCLNGHFKFQKQCTGYPEPECQLVLIIIDTI